MQTLEAVFRGNTGNKKIFEIFKHVAISINSYFFAFLLYHFHPLEMLGEGWVGRCASGRHLG